MYRSTPVTYLASSLLSTGISGANVTFVLSELLHVMPPSPLTCAQYLSSYLQTSDAHLPTPENLTACSICPLSNTRTLLASVAVCYEHRWRNFVISLVYSTGNVGGRVGTLLDFESAEEIGNEKEEDMEITKVRRRWTTRGL